MAKREDVQSVHLVMPKDMHQRLIKLAKADDRTLTSYILSRLKAAADAEEKANA